MVWNMEGGVIADCDGHAGKVTSLAFNREATQMIVGYFQGILKNFDVDENSDHCSTCLCEYRSHDREVTAVTFSIKGSDIISGSRQRM